MKDHSCAKHIVLEVLEQGKKVGIITFHKSLNYGSALQAWALSRFLMKRNHNVRIVDFTPANYSKLYDLFFIPTTIGFFFMR